MPISVIQILTTRSQHSTKLHEFKINKIIIFSTDMKTKNLLLIWLVAYTIVSPTILLRIVSCICTFNVLLPMSFSFQFDLSLVSSSSCKVALDRLNDFNKMELARQISDPDELKHLITELKELIQVTFKDRFVCNYCF